LKQDIAHKLEAEALQAAREEAEAEHKVAEEEHKHVIAKGRWHKAHSIVTKFEAQVGFKNLEEKVKAYWATPFDEACDKLDVEMSEYAFTAVEWTTGGPMHIKVKPFKLVPVWNKKQNAIVSAAHKGLPEHLKVGAILTAINGRSVIGWEFDDIMSELKKGERPLVIQFLSPVEKRHIKLRQVSRYSAMQHADAIATDAEGLEIDNILYKAEARRERQNSKDKFLFSPSASPQSSPKLGPSRHSPHISPTTQTVMVRSMSSLKGGAFGL